MNMTALTYSEPTQMVTAEQVRLWLKQGADDAVAGIHENPYTSESLSGVYWQMGHDKAEPNKEQA